MAGALRKTMLYLGLADESAGAEEYYEEYAEPAESAVEYAPSQTSYEAEVTPIRRDIIAQSTVSSSVTSHSAGSEAKASPDLRRISTIHPRSYNDARVIGEAFRGGTPVIINLTDMDDADAKRLVDFSAGLIFGLHGGIERVTSKVFLLSPEHVEVLGSDDVAPATGPGRFYNQS
jgi:cell division inhibitor SepF